jgi:hypothetical protein
MDDAPLQAAEKVRILQRVAAYYALCERVRKSSVGSLVFGGIMLSVWYFLLPDRLKCDWFGIVYLVLASAEFGTGLLNRFAPSAEGVLLDGLVLMLFGGWNVLREALTWQGILPGQVSGLFVFFGLYWCYQGLQHCKNYGVLRKLFAERPTWEHIRWYNGLLKEVRFADPKEDAQSLALPTRPPITAKLLGDIAFFTIVAGEPIITTRDQVTIALIDSDESNARPEAVLAIEGNMFHPFPISAANWENYRRWKAEAPQQPIQRGF